MLKSLTLATVITAAILAAPVAEVYTVTAYCPCAKCCDKETRVTASGYKIKKGDRLCAADKKFKFGTRLMVPGYGTVPVLDRGGAIKGNHIDVYFDTHKEALKWGVKRLRVKVIKEIK